jgi:peptide/nickel transport system permease protein
MAAYLIRRLVFGLFVLVGVSLITFVVAFAVPADPARAIAGPHATPAVLANIRHLYGLDQPLPLQYVHYVANALMGNLGQSYSLSEGVLPAILSRLPATAVLAVCGVCIELAIGLPIGIVSAIYAGRFPDRAGIIFALVGFSVPAFVLGNLFLIVFAFHWTIFPLGGDSGPTSVILPALTIGLGGAAWYSRLLRTTMIDVLRMPYIQTARAKGVSRPKVIVKHALRNAVGPLVTQFGLDLAYFLGGLVVVETVFAWPGVGQLAFNAITQDDINLIMGTVLIAAVFVVLANILVDVVQAWLDPRIRLG